MPPLLDPQHVESPEKLISRVVAQLRNHVLWDSLLLFFPPLFVALYVVTYLYRSAWIAQIGFLALGASAVAGALIAVVARYRPSIPSVRTAARLVDQKTAAKDRFITLATIEPSSCSTTLLGRLRGEANGLLNRIELRRDFPYKIKRSFYGSVMVSILAVVFFHLLLPFAQSKIPSTSPHEKIGALAEKMAQRPRLSDLARDLRTLATKLQDPKISQQERQALIQEMQRKVEEQQRREDQKDNRDLLGQASSALQGLEQQSGDNQQKNQEKGGGGVQDNLPQEGQGEGKRSQGSGGDSQGNLKAQLSKDMQQGKAAQGDPKEPGQEKNQRNQSDGKGNQPDPNKPDRDKSRETTGKTQGGSEEKIGRSKSEEIPQGAPPAERYYRPGERGNEGIKGAGYVTVQLPEEIAADSKGGGTPSKESRESRIRRKVPVSNIPLPAHVPDAPTEKQQMPLEYRGIIR